MPDAVALAFDRDQVCELTGLSRRQLSYWETTGFFVPSHKLDRTRVYTFRDLVGLRTIAQLRQRKVPLQELRRIGAWLHKEYETPWASLRFFVGGRSVFFHDPSSDKRFAASQRGQEVFEIAMEEIANSVRDEIVRRQQRPPKQRGVIQRRRSVLSNAPVLAGTRIPTSAVFSFYEAGYSIDGIIREYPSLTPKDVRAALAYERKRRERKAS